MQKSILSFQRVASWNITVCQLKSKDKYINNSGCRHLNDICKKNNLFILNSRLGKDKGASNYTFRSTSVIDYTVVSGF